MKSEKSEKRSMTESQNPPNADSICSSFATLPSMKSKMLATTINTKPVMKCPNARAHAAAILTTTPVKVRTLGWMRSATHRLMIARSG